MTHCAVCRAECEQVRVGMAIVEHLPPVESPEAIWASIEAAFQENRSRKTSTVRRWRLAFAATVVLAFAGAAYWRATHQSGTRWEVARLDGSPAVGAKHIRGVG